MGLSVVTNVRALAAHRALTWTDNNMTRSLERLASGSRLNRAADDAAGLAISQNLRVQVSGMGQAIRNIQDGINVVRTADGGRRTGLRHRHPAPHARPRGPGRERRDAERRLETGHPVGDRPAQV